MECKKGVMEKELKIAAGAVLFFLFVTRWASAQQIDQNLWGTWELNTVELTKQGVVAQKSSLTDLFANKNNLPRNMFTQLYFFDDQIGVNSTETEFVSAENLSLKGNYTANDGTLIVTMYGEPSRIFTYALSNERLEIWYTEEGTQFYLVYKLIVKYVE